MGVDVSILIVTYECRDDVLACLRSLERTTPDCRYEVIIVDNASSDGTVAALARSHPEVRIIASPTNLGFARGVNLAATAAEGEFLLLLNPDTLVLDGTIEELLRFARAHQQYAAYGGRTLDPAGRLDPRSAWAAPTLWSMTAFALALNRLGRLLPLLDPEAMRTWRRDSVRPVDIVTGCLLLMRRTTWDAFAGLDPTYFVYGEDADLGLRIRAAGLESVIDPDAVIVHRVGASSSHRADKMTLVMQGRATLLRTHWSGWRRRFGIGALQLGAATRAAADRLGRIARISRSADVDTWGAVWHARRTWRRGFPPPSSDQGVRDDQNRVDHRSVVGHR